MSTIIPITGGLGNQLFQYAHGLKLSYIDKKKVIFDISFFGDTHNDTHRPFLLPYFNIDPQATFEHVRTHAYKKYFKKIIYKITGRYPLYQQEKYFMQVKNEVLKQYTLKNPPSTQAEEMKKQILATQQPVSIHIRRGDFVQNPKTNAYHGVCDLDYYRRAIQYMKATVSHPIFFIFSDDIAWATNNLQLENTIFVSNPEIPDYEELILMSSCKHHIIANSTFSWWAAYLNTSTEKTIVAPKQWTVQKTADELGILPENWTQL